MWKKSLLNKRENEEVISNTDDDGHSAVNIFLNKCLV